MKKIIFLLFLMLSVLEFAADYYGAIVLDKQTGETHYSYDYSSYEEAENAAMELCKGKCKVAVTVSNGCAAVAHSNKTKGYAAEYGEDEKQLERQVLNECGETDCKVTWVCTSVDDYYYEDYYDYGSLFDFGF